MGKQIRFGKERHEVYIQKWCTGYILENDHAKLVWVFEFNLRKMRTSRKPDWTSEDKGKKIFIVARQNEKGRKYKQLA